MNHDRNDDVNNCMHVNGVCCCLCVCLYRCVHGEREREREVSTYPKINHDRNDDVSKCMYVNDVHNRLSLFPIVLSLYRHRERGSASRNAEKRTRTAGGRKTLLSNPSLVSMQTYS